MSVVLCLPAHLCVSPQRPVAGPPRERVNMHSICFDMLTPMLYISVCRKIYGVIRGKGLAHVPMVSSEELN